MKEIIKSDIAIIGAGAGGLSIAAVAAQLGLKVVLIESNKMGGDCLNTGCIPSKSLIAAAKAAHGLITSTQFGIEPAILKINFVKVMEHVTNIIAKISHNDSIERFTKLGVHIIQAHGKFIDKKTLEAGNNHIQSRQFVIATGSSPAIPPISGLTQVEFLTNENVFQLREQPSHLIIIGGGAIGCELAQAFLFLGSTVTVLEAFNILPRDEPDLVEIIRAQLIGQGLILHETTKILQVTKANNSFEILIEKNGVKELIKGSHLLVATGRRANVDNLGLENANVAFTSKGIQVDNRLRTTNSKIYAIGDVTGPYLFTHIANYHASIVIKNAIFKIPASVNYNSIPWVTYTFPELAHTGLTSQQALKKDKNVKILSIDLAENDRAQTERETIGKIKIAVTKKGKIIGSSILAPHAGELIVPWIMLINDKKSLHDLTNTIIPYPTLSEINKRVAIDFYLPKLFSNLVRRLVNFLKYF